MENKRDEAALAAFRFSKEEPSATIGSVIRTEALLCIAALSVAAVWANQIARATTRAASRARKFANHRIAATLIVFILAIAVRLVLLPVEPIPVPTISDEFSYLLMADTFAHGRVANPPHPMWQHFETFHVNWHPRYVSKYYPAQGIFLAIGQAEFGNAFWGVVFSSALMCAAICWMLQEWVSPGWALVGGMLAVARLDAFSYWNDSYYGGAVTALGGALVLGALIRLWRYSRVRDGLIMSAGFALLFGSRPYESLAFTAPVFVAIIAWLARNKTQAARAFTAIGLSSAIVAAALSFYFWRTDGSPVRPPYMINRAEYENVPVFPWASLPPEPDYRHNPIGQGNWDLDVDQYYFARSHPVEMLALRNFAIWDFFVGLALSIPILLAFLALPKNLRVSAVPKDVRFLFAVGIAVLIAVCSVIVFNPHYVSPATCLAYWAVVSSMRYLTSWRAFGRAASIMTIALCVALVPIRAFSHRLGISTDSSLALATWDSPFSQLNSRADIVSRLNREQGLHLVIVRYGPSHYAPIDWVYNSADIDGSKIVWARDMGEEKNAEIIEYFRVRKVWLLEPDGRPAKLSPYALRR